MTSLHVPSPLPASQWTVQDGESFLDPRRIEELTMALIAIPSMNGTPGEAVIADVVTEHLRGLAYFQAHPAQVWTVPMENDQLSRKNVFALVRGEKGPSPETVILHCHTDTVGIEDYGALAQAAFDPERLARELRSVDLPVDAAQDLASGDWIFGRGSVDMKSGLAVHLELVRTLSEHLQDFAGNVLFMANPVEETRHGGIEEALPVLRALREKEGLRYALAINTDYIAPLYAGDPKRYLYLGSVGKLLPCFYIKGAETHVGECFNGFSPNLVAAEIERSIDLDVDLCDVFEGEYTLPPVSLKLADLKPYYNVQTPGATFLYFNWFLHGQAPDQTLAILKQRAAEAVAQVQRRQKEQHARYAAISGIPYLPAEFDCRIVTYEELLGEVHTEAGPAIDDQLARIVADLKAKGTDLRIICRTLVETLVAARRSLEPVVVVYFSPPYVPKNTIKGETASEKRVLRLVKDIAFELARDTGEVFEVRKFFPCMSDSSFLALDDSDESMAALVHNLPEWGNVYQVPIQQIREMNVPAITMGCYGKGAHTWTERLYRPYSFNVLPRLILQTTLGVFHEQD
jgi:arginine utilization protein RocB